MAEEIPAFRIIEGEREYTIYASGRVEGFDKTARPFIVVNRIPVIARAEANKAVEQAK